MLVRFARRCALLLALFAASAFAVVPSDDAAVSQAVSDVLSGEYAQASFGDAKKKLLTLVQRCNKGKCTAATRAQVHVALGMVASQVGQAEEAKTEFSQALAEDPSAKLPSSGTTPTIRAQWAAAAPPPPKEEEQPAPSPTAKPPGWNSAEAFQAAIAALTAGKAGKFAECIEKDKQSLALEEQPRTRLHLGYCEQQAGKILDALRDTSKALEEGIKRKDAPLMNLAKTRVQELIAKIPHVTFVPPPGVTDLSVIFDDKPVKSENINKRFSIDPGKHKVRAEGTQSGVPLTFDQEYDVKEGEDLVVTITLKSQAPEYLTPGQMKCMLSAKSQEEVLKCLPEDKKNLVVKVGIDTSAYTDTNAVNVITPAINGSVTSPTAGWNIGGSYLLDVVTAASPDVVSMASRAFRDRRHAATLGGGYKTGIFNFQGGGNFSLENDYLSAGGNGAVSFDLRDKTITPRIAYAYQHDVIGRVGLPFSLWPQHLDTMVFEAGITFVLSPKTVLLASGTLQTERGDQSKPYRYLPVFPENTFGGANPPLRLPNGASIDLVNANRLPLKPREQLPVQRDRWAIGMRFVHRLTPTATLRLEQRLYADTWDLKATTTDARYVMDFGKRIRVWPHARVNAQTGVSFYQYPYTARLEQDGSISLPLFRTTDRELSPLITVTVGGGTRVSLTSPESKTQIGLSLSADVMYTRFFQTLYITQRTAVYGTVGIDAEFD